MKFRATMSSDTISSSHRLTILLRRESSATRTESVSNSTSKTQQVSVYKVLVDSNTSICISIITSTGISMCMLQGCGVL